MNNEKKNRKDFSVYTLRVTLFLIIAGIIYYRPSPLLFVPLLVSAFIMFLQSKVSRFAFLIGAFNSVLYAIAYTIQTLYSTALYAFLVSFPFQLLTFFNWSKNTKENKTALRELSIKKRIFIFGGMLVLWLVLLIIFSSFGSKYLIMDNAVSVIGILSTILCVFRFKEYVFTQFTSNVIMLITYLLMLDENPSMFIWVVSVTNNLVCTILAWINMKHNAKKIC